MAAKSFGVAVTIGGTAILGLTDVNISGRDVTAVDTTSHDTEDNARTFVGGLVDNGTLELTGNYTGANAGLTYMEGHLGDVVSATVTYSDASSHSFDVVVGAPSYDNPLDDKIGFTVSCKISGPVS
jgi:hypothetical protein